MAVTTSNYIFLPWVRQGAASGIQALDMSANQTGVVSVTVKLPINDEPDIDGPVRVQVRLYGPGDVIGIDPQQIIRTEPRHLTMDFEPNYFPAIEFDRPDFPWLFTPAAPDAAGRLRPWLCLVVVRKQQGIMVRSDRNRPLPVLEIMDPAKPGQELPELSESWAWAHAQVIGSQPDHASLKSALAGDPALTVSRLLCPRRLDPATEYLACVVPAFELGRKAGLGLPIAPGDEQTLDPAWAPGAEQVTLPVYFQWEFRTGTGGDFEALVQLLEAREARDMPSAVGKRRMDISHPGFQITPPLPPGTTLELEGALRLLDAPATEWPESSQTPFQQALKPILDAPWQAWKEGREPLLAPPLYGSWQAARYSVNLSPESQASLTWLDELNLDPRHRAVAALGTQVVQTQQEPLMASAWEQLGESERINQWQRQAQLGRAVNAVYHAKHFSRFSEETLLNVVAPAQGRVVLEAVNANNVKPWAMFSQRISESAIPIRALSAPVRRLTSPRGVIRTRFRTVGAPSKGMVAMLNTTTPIVSFQKKAAGLVTMNGVSDEFIPIFDRQLVHTIRYEKVPTALEAAPQLDHFVLSTEGDVSSLLVTLGLQNPGGQDTALARTFRETAKALHTYLVPQAPSSFHSMLAQPMDLENTKNTVLHNIHPEKTFTARVQASLRRAASGEPAGDPLAPILDTPTFPQPMYEALRDLSQDFLFPGLEHVPPNTVALLKTNPTFIESFLVGLNTEMSRELLWRNYPANQGGTSFQQFWDRLADDTQGDIQPINAWGPRKLGENAHAGEKLVMLVRGELLRRYPNSVIYAVKAEAIAGRLDLSRDPTQERHPLFRGTLNPDVTFLGFDLTEHEVMADAGWFFVIQQQPTEPRFGMDAADFKEPLPPLTTWNNLSWRHVVNTEEELKALSHASVKTALPVSAIGDVVWGKNSSHQAYITLQRPVRIAIHARQMIKHG